VKGGDDLRQELFAMQLIKKFDDIFKQTDKFRLYLKPYEIIITSENSGIIEYCPNTLSMDAMKKYLGERLTLRQFFVNYFDHDFNCA
jgi:phosphatidylinositol 4-kinase